MRDVQSRDDIKLLIDTFYTKVRTTHDRLHFQ